MIAYAVTIEIADSAARDAFLTWLVDAHAADVCAAGALDAEVSLRDDGAIEARYHFASREAFAAYERDHAPRLRAEGLARAPKEGARFGRTLAQVRTRRTR